MPYFHVVFTLPAAIADIAYQNKAVIYDLLFKASADTLITIAADPKHLGARIGIISVLHTWGSALTHHPHLHVIVPGGGVSLDGARWVSCRPGFFLPVRVLSRLFRRLFLKKLLAAHEAGRLQFFGNHAPLADAQAFATYLAPLRRAEWVVYSKRPLGGPEAVLAYLSRYTHRVAISNSRLIAFDQQGVTFRWKNYRIEGRDRYKLMTLTSDEFIRQFLIHVLPKGFPPHPPLRPVRQGGRHRQHRARPRTARRAKAPKRTRRCCRSQPVGMSMLRRPHEHHRDIPARRDPAPSANRSNDQDRHVMTAPVPRCKCARFVRWFSAGSDNARPNIRLPCQTAQLTAKFGAPSRSLQTRIPPADVPDRLILNHAHHWRHSNPHSA